MSDKPKTILQGQRTRARAALENATGRYEGTSRVVFDDGWDIEETDRLIKTEVRAEVPRTAITYNKSPDIPFDRSINPYRGCEHGCIYCFARPTHAYLNLSPGLDFETRLVARPGMGDVLTKELRARSYAVDVIAIGTNTDPYQPCEAEWRIMREVLEVLAACNHPLAIVTKGTLVERDLDLLAPMAAKGLLRVGVSVTTLDADLSRKMEPRAPHPARRLGMIRRLAEAGVPVRAMVAPVVPGLTDHELEPVLEAVKAAGAAAASYISLRLPMEVSPLFQDWLAEHFPDRAAKVMGRVRELHGGKDYDARWGQRFRGQGVWADLMRQRFAKAAGRLGLLRDMGPLRRDLFVAPTGAGDQLSLF